MPCPPFVIGHLGPHFFFLNDPAPPELSPLPHHAALPIGPENVQPLDTPEPRLRTRHQRPFVRADALHAYAIEVGGCRGESSRVRRVWRARLEFVRQHVP